MTFLAFDWTDLLDNPEIIGILLVVIIGALRAVTVGAKKVTRTFAEPGQRQRRELEGLRAGGRRRGPRDRGDPRDGGSDEEEYVDPEEMLPGFLRPRAWRDAQAAGVVPVLAPIEEEKEAEPPPHPVRPEPVKQAVPVVEGRRKKRRRPRVDDHGGHLRENGLPRRGRGEVAGVTRSGSTGRRLKALLGDAPTGRLAVRRAVLWQEILGPPRAIRAYRTPAARRAGSKPAPPKRIGS